MRHAPQAVHIPVLLTIGLARSAYLLATSAWERFHGVAQVQQLRLFRFTVTGILLTTWSGRPLPPPTPPYLPLSLPLSFILRSL
jgi:hypothetical protein